MASPPKPWEQGGASAASATSSTAAVAAAADPIGASVGPTLQAQTSTLPGAPVGPYGSTSTVGMYNNPSGLYGPSTASPYGTTGYGSTYGSPYGASSPYGSYGSSPMYGGGYGAGGYGGYGSSYGGYGSTYGGGYGGYGGGYGGYGGYGGMSRYGGYGGYGGMSYGAGGMGPGMMGPEMGWLGGLHQTIGSMGQISELLGMNAEAMQFAFGAFGNFLERIGGATQEIFHFFVGTPPVRPIDPRTGQPLPHMVDPRTGQPIVDPRTGQPVPIPTPEEFADQRKKRFIRWVLGVAVVYFGFRVIRSMFLSRKPRIMSSPGLNAAFNEVQSRQMGGFGGPSLFGSDVGPAGAQTYPAFRGGSMTDSFESAFSGKKNFS